MPHKYPILYVMYISKFIVPNALSLPVSGLEERASAQHAETEGLEGMWLLSDGRSFVMSICISLCPSI